MDDASKLFTNSLIHEKSPYLLQHAHNPVQWLPWGLRAFEKAASENKPVFLSIGYSTCHWCHVMERESFENEKTAKILNENFISIKVDREERPEIDHIYMQYVTATTGRGGWPMSVFLTPDQKPFYGGTYFPPEDRYGMPGFTTLLLSIADAWKNRRQEIEASADSAKNFLKESISPTKESMADDPVKEASAIFEKAFGYFKSSYDEEYAGFGKSLKFPRSHALSMLLRHAYRSGSKEALAIALNTLSAMARGGLQDQLGGGFHRYSTDRQWRIPHFEKMLYDQALLARTYLEAYQATENEFYSKTARKILDYVLLEMTDSRGGFFSAQDADSPDPEDLSRKREGAFFLWKKEEIFKVLPAQQAEITCFYYGIEDQGNAIEDPHHEFGGKNVLYEARSKEETAEKFGLALESLEILLSEMANTLKNTRGSRPRPHCDDKILTDWNALMISSFALAGRVLGDSRYTQAALRASCFIEDFLFGGDGKLLHRYRDNESGIEAFLSDYIFYAEACLELYETTFDSSRLFRASALAKEAIRLFWDSESGGFFMTQDSRQALIARPKEVYDGAVPSGNSVAALLISKLARITGDEIFCRTQEKIWKFLSVSVFSDPPGFTQALIALDFASNLDEEIVIAGKKEDPAVWALKKEADRAFLPGRILLFSAEEPERKRLDEFSPLFKGKEASTEPQVFICRMGQCEKPIQSVKELVHFLDRRKRE